MKSITPIYALNDLPGGLSYVTVDGQKFLVSVGQGRFSVSAVPVDAGAPAPPPDDEEEDDEVQLISEPGVWHVATLSNGSRQEDHVKVPEGKYKGVTVAFEVFNDGWRDSGDLYNLFWLVLNGNRNMFGYGNALREHKLMLRHGFGQRQEEKPKKLIPFPWDQHTWYSVRFKHMFEGSVSLTVKMLDVESSEVTVSMDSDIHAPVTIGPRDVLRFHTGFDETSNPNEPAPDGWVWRDVHVSMLK